MMMMNPADAPGGVADPVHGPEIDLGAPSRFERDAEPVQIRCERRRRRRAFACHQPWRPRYVNVDLAQTVSAHHDLMHRHRIEQLVRDEDAVKRGGKISGARREPADDLVERRALRVARGSAGLDEMEPDAIVERRLAEPQRAQNVGGQSAVARPGLEEIETGVGIRGSGFEDREHLRELPREQLAEERADVDAGKKIARASRSLGRAGVVTDLGIVKREIHERGHRQQAALLDPFANPS